MSWFIAGRCGFRGASGCSIHGVFDLRGWHVAVRARRPGAFSDGNAIDVTRLHLTMKWVVSFSILSAYVHTGPSRTAKL